MSDQSFLTDSVNPDQIAAKGSVWSGSTLFAIPSALRSCKKMDRTSVKLMSHLRKMTKLTKWKSDKN